MAKNKIKFQTWKLNNFTVTETKYGIKIYDRHRKWHTEYNEDTHACQMIRHLLIEGKLKELEDVIAAIYYVAFNIVTDADLVAIVRDYFSEKFSDKLNPIDEEQDQKDLEEVKQNQKLKEELMDGEKENTEGV